MKIKKHIPDSAKPGAKLCTLICATTIVLGVLTLGSAAEAHASTTADSSVPSPESFVIAAKLNTPSQGPVLHQVHFPPPPPAPLTDEQMSKITKIKDRFRIATASKEAEQQALVHDMGELLAEPQINRQEVKNLQSRLTSIRTELSQARLDMLLDCAEVYTAEQRKGYYRQTLMMQSGMPAVGFPPHDVMFSVAAPHAQPIVGFEAAEMGLGHGFTMAAPTAGVRLHRFTPPMPPLPPPPSDEKRK